MKQNYETGRSMIEMLGTLAIIGVLSLGGIMGYSYAMDKYRANETLNEIMMRLNTLQMQANQNADLNLNEFDDKTTLGYVIGDNYDWAEDDTLIYMGVSGIPERVCNIIYEEMIEKVERIDVTADRQSGSSVLCGDKNEMVFFMDSGMHVECDPACAEDEYCMAGIKCLKDGYKYAGASCKTTSCEECYECRVDWKTCTPVSQINVECNEGKGICVNGTCLPKNEQQKCSDNSDCPMGMYCTHHSKSTSYNPFVCAPVDFMRMTITLSNGKTEVWYKTPHEISWWNAKKSCEAIGKRMPTKEELTSERVKKMGHIIWSSTKKENLAYTNAGWQGISYIGVLGICR